MCLGIPGQVAEFAADNADLAKVDIAGVRRTINVALLADEGLEVGDWVLIHVGFAMARIDEEEARMALEGLMLMGSGFDDEVGALMASQIEPQR
jgi:hydrogenase expression/formation protein HypC